MKADSQKIILFLCNWGPHSAYHLLQDDGYRIPAEVQMVRIPCTGRISKALLFKAFEMGADGVALVGCAPGTCRYGTGTASARKNTEDTRRILRLLGVGEARMRLATFLPDEASDLEQFLAEFAADLKTIGKSPIMPAHQQDETPPESVRELLRRHDAYSCQDCGKCTASCPLALSGKSYSPRAIVSAIIRGELDATAVSRDVHACLTCGICHDRCPSDVDFPAFIRDIRCHLSGRNEDRHRQPHGGFFQSLMRAMASPDVKPDRWDFLPPDLHTHPESKVLFFGGCAPYFDAFFKNHFECQTSSILTDSLRLLNFFDVHPRLMPAERCCGHDLLWSGDREGFLRLARLNVAQLNDLGIEEVITACPECYRSLAVDYPAHGLKPEFKVTHLYAFLENQIDKGAITFKSLSRRITYQDACRLTRNDTLSDLPRRLLHRLSTAGFTEMKDNGPSALCCGNCAWGPCDAGNKALQVQRLGQARATGSDLLVTSCPKCQIHLRCAMEDPFRGDDIRMEMADLTSVIAHTIQWE
jgi:Fe-S oxidoreductase/coenzyme F420-reducing hydrogenase delta subunit